MRIGLAALVCLALAAATDVAGQTRLTGPARIVDGDTLDIGPIRIRLHGVDSPETGQTCATPGGGGWGCGAAAATRLETLTAGADVACDLRKADDYHRIIAVCAARDRDLGETLVAEGLAWAFLRYSADYAPVEADARKIGAGIWRADTPPAWDYRATAWASASESAPAGCPIKGNISRSGERIYHTPWSPAYARTAIRADAGERWFCDEGEAEAAGWRAAAGARP